MTSPVITDILLRGNADWVYLAEVVWSIKSIEGEQEKDKMMERSLSVIRELLASGLADIGDVTDGGFFEWNMPLDEAIDRVRTEWMALDHDLWPGDVCWLANTPAGDRLAEKIFQQREADGCL